MTGTETTDHPLGPPPPVIPPPPSGPPPVERPEWHRVARAAAIGLYAGALVAVWWMWGIPLDREQILLWVAGGLVVLTIGSPGGGPVRVVRDWLPVVLVLILYDLTRGKADELGIQPHLDPQLAFDRWIGLGELPTLRLQHALYGPGPVRWWEIPVTFTYISHFFVPFAVAAVFWVRDRARYWRYVRRFVTLSFAAALTFVLYPAIPPWMAARFGEVDPIVRTAPRGWGHRWIHLDIAQDVIRAGWDTANLVAAVPSLHAGYTALVAVMLWPTARPAVRALLALYVIAMGFVLVLSGEHYVFDVLVGWAYVAVVCLVWNRLERHPVPFWRRSLKIGAGSPAAHAPAGAAPRADCVRRSGSC